MKSMDRGDPPDLESMDQSSRRELENFIGYPALRWMSAAENDAAHAACLQMIDEYVNLGYFNLGKYKDLQAMLLSATGARTWVKHVYIKGPQGPKRTGFLSLLYSAFPHMKEDEAIQWMGIQGVTGLMELAARMGLQGEDLKKLKEELKDAEWIHE